MLFPVWGTPYFEGATRHLSMRQKNYALIPGLLPHPEGLRSNRLEGWSPKDKEKQASQRRKRKTAWPGPRPDAPGLFPRRSARNRHIHPL